MYSQPILVMMTSIYFLQHNVHVTTIDLSNNNLGPEGASNVAQLPLENRNVVDLVRLNKTQKLLISSLVVKT